MVQFETNKVKILFLKKTSFIFFNFVDELQPGFYNDYKRKFLKTKAK